MGLYPNYIVKVGETVRDVIINSTGSMGSDTVSNWNEIAKANSFTDWTPELIPGQAIIIPDTVFIDANTFRNRQTYPANNSTVSNFLDLINAVWSLLTNNWILRTGFWDDGGLWIDTDSWIDNL